MRVVTTLKNCDAQQLQNRMETIANFIVNAKGYGSSFDEQHVMAQTVRQVAQHIQSGFNLLEEVNRRHAQNAAAFLAAFVHHADSTQLKQQAKDMVLLACELATLLENELQNRAAVERE